MTEEIKEYGEKAITYTELADFVRDICMQKIKENAHKDDILKRGFENLVIRTSEERHERLDAGASWYYEKTDENALEFLREIADEIIFLQAQAGKVLGYTTLERR
jgi:hypothetical protein